MDTVGYMSRCIICGTEVDGTEICALHEEDVVFTFTGDRPNDLVEGRYYEGTVDGITDFGVFVDLSERVTGLLHRNDIPRRLESLQWGIGDTVCVQVTSINDNGNVDLGWSKRRTPAEFRGQLEHGASEDPSDEPERTDTGGGATTSVAISRRDEDLDRTQIRSIERYFGREVVLAGVVETIRQTGGPTVFTLRDESGTVDCAAFAGAGVRAYPSVEEGDTIHIRGAVERRFGDFQIEVESLELLEGEIAETVRSRVADGRQLPASIDELPLLYDDAASLAIETDIREAAAAIRRAVEQEQTIRLRHPATVDGYVAAAAIERAIEVAVGTDDPAKLRSLVRRKPIEGAQYAVSDAVDDAVQLGDPADDTDPFVVLIGVGSAGTPIASYDLLDLYDIEYYVIDRANPDTKLLDRVDPLVNPWCGEGTYPIPTTTALTVNVASLMAKDVRDDLGHLPAIVARGDIEGTTERLLEQSRYDRHHVETMRQAIALEAYYQPWADKRVLVRRLLFERDIDAVEPISEQFRLKLESTIETATHNADVYDINGDAMIYLDIEAYGNRFEFPPTPVLLEELVASDAISGSIAVGLGNGVLEVYTSNGVDVHRFVEELDHAAPEAGVTLDGGANGRIRFLPGARDAVGEAAVEAARSLNTA